APGRSGALRAAGLVAVLVLLVLVGIGIGRLVRGGDAGESAPPPAKPATSAPSRPAPPARVRFGPLVATVTGRLAAPAQRAATATLDGRIAVAGGAGSAAVLLGRPDGKLARVAKLPEPLAGAIPVVSG